MLSKVEPKPVVGKFEDISKGFIPDDGLALGDINWGVLTLDGKTCFGFGLILPGDIGTWCGFLVPENVVLDSFFLMF